LFSKIVFAKHVGVSIIQDGLVDSLLLHLSAFIQNGDALLASSNNFDFKVLSDILAKLFSSTLSALLLVQSNDILTLLFLSLLG